MEETKNLCVQLPISLHAKVREEQEKSGKVLTAYFTELLTEYYEKRDKKMENTRTLAFQVPEEMFQRIKDYLANESERVGRKISQREFILGLIENALEQPEENQSEYN
jgi:transketolase